ncbi:hypothetical protein SAMN02745134_01559 [Clostridium acidisoli DSM 12555]|uniref:BNR/Asp-box repeat-containing protein n=1 Tax=Clostridium acidisoli DSM 12555 TaxID=1121291 RepID=A0A1W1XF55_9CLOT|nr:hypothetical protein [Clostridium acidisoli]SMC22151.1 hypothetical protein SAMN02745134_01559 [Clostridium acidisoli DSM 12555]
MEKHNKNTTKGLVLSIITCFVFVLVYWISFYELYTLCKFGRVKHNVTILLGCMVFFLAFFIILIIRVIKMKEIKEQQGEDRWEEHSRSKIIRICAVVISIVIITCFYGVKIYNSSINYNGKLSWVLRDLKNKKSVELEHNNIYETGIEGILTDINKKINMPEKLYVASNFSLTFDSNGKITTFDTYVYGKNDKGKLESYLISYNSNNSKNITIILNGYVNANYSNDKLLEPLIKTVKVIPLKKTVSSWNEKQYGILYYGKRSFGYNTQGIVYIDSKGKVNSPTNAYSEIVGYIVSVYVPGKENQYPPVRYNLVSNLNNIKTPEPSTENKNIFDQSYNTSNKFYLSKQVGYRLEITAAAAGSRSYSLTGTRDGGTTWNTINADPFSGKIGVAAGITFLNDKLGFLCLSYSGGTNGQLYRTEDGGVTYKMVNFPEIKVALKSGESYNPFDLPGMPYKKDGSLNVLVGEGSDGDYNGNSKALYQSKDNGITWQYVKEVNKN